MGLFGFWQLAQMLHYFVHWVFICVDFYWPKFDYAIFDGAFYFNFRSKHLASKS